MAVLMLTCAQRASPQRVGDGQVQVGVRCTVVDRTSSARYTQTVDGDRVRETWALGKRTACRTAQCSLPAAATASVARMRSLRSKQQREAAKNRHLQRVLY